LRARAAEQTLQETHGLLRAVIDRLPLAYLRMDADCRVLDWNQAAEKMFGYSREEALGRVALDLIVPLSVIDHVLEIIRRLRAGDMDAHSVNENRTKDGRIIYLGVATGYVVTFEDGLTIYYSGDTSIFGDMRLIGELYAPTIAFLPIGDLYTMGPEQAAKACELLGVKQVVPMHYGTFPALTGTPAKLRELVAPRGVQVLELRPGETTE